MKIKILLLLLFLKTGSYAQNTSNYLQQLKAIMEASIPELKGKVMTESNNALYKTDFKLEPFESYSFWRESGNYYYQASLDLKGASEEKANAFFQQLVKQTKQAGSFDIRQDGLSANESGWSATFYQQEKEAIVLLAFEKDKGYRFVITIYKFLGAKTQKLFENYLAQLKVVLQSPLSKLKGELIGDSWGIKGYKTDFSIEPFKGPYLSTINDKEYTYITKVGFTSEQQAILFYELLVHNTQKTGNYEVKEDDDYRLYERSAGWARNTKFLVNENRLIDILAYNDKKSGTYLITLSINKSISTAAAPDIAQLKSWSKISSIMRQPVSTGKSLLAEYGYTKEKSGDISSKIKGHYFQNPDYGIDDPMLGKTGDAFVLGSRNDKIAAIHFSIYSKKDNETLNHIKENEEFERAIAKAGFAEISVKKEEDVVIKHFYNHSAHLKIRLETFHLSSRLLARVTIYEGDIQDSEI